MPASSSLVVLFVEFCLGAGGDRERAVYTTKLMNG